MMNTLHSIHQTLIAAEEAHPDSPALAALHRALWKGLKRHKAELGLSDSDVSTFSGGTNKVDDGDGE